MIRHGLGVVLLLLPILCTGAEKKLGAASKNSLEPPVGHFIPWFDESPCWLRENNSNYFIVIGQKQDSNLIAQACTIYEKDSLFSCMPLPENWDRSVIGGHLKDARCLKNIDYPVLGASLMTESSKVDEALTLHSTTVLFLSALSERGVVTKNINDPSLIKGQASSLCFLLMTSRELALQWKAIYNTLKSQNKKFEDMRLTTIVENYPQSVIEELEHDTTGELVLCCNKDKLAHQKRKASSPLPDPSAPKKQKTGDGE